MKKKEHPANKDELWEYLSCNMKMRVKLEFGPDDHYQFITSLIGYKTGHSIILDYPRSVMEALIVRKLTNVNVVISGISHTEMGHIVAFKSSVITTSTRPLPMLFCRVPQHFVTKKIRQHKRIKLSLPVTIQNEMGLEPIHGTLVDLSVSGCGIFIDHREAMNAQNSLHKHSNVILSCSLTDCINAPLHSKIANMVKQQHGHMLGLRFTDTLPINDAVKTMLFEYTIFDQLNEASSA